MKTQFALFSLLLCLLSSVNTFASSSQQCRPNKETECGTDGCVFRKQDMNEVAWKWIHNDQHCEDTVSWLQSFRIINDDTYEIVCGDTTDRQITVIKVKEKTGSDDEYDVVVLSKKWAK